MSSPLNNNQLPQGSLGYKPGTFTGATGKAASVPTGAAGASSGKGGPGLGTVMAGIDMAKGAFTSGKEAVESGAGGGEVAIESLLGTIGMEDLYTSNRLKEQAEKEEENVAGMGATQDLLAQNKAALGAPVAMLSKELKSIPYNPPLNMSASEYKSSLKMEQISGISERRTNEKKY